MKLLLEQIGIALCGLVTTIVVVVVNVTILHWTHWDLVGFSYNFIPVGAIAGAPLLRLAIISERCIRTTARAGLCLC